MAITSVSGSTPQDDNKQVNLKPQEKNPQDIKIFGDKNNNKIVDKEDFNNQEFASYAEANGFIGKAWESIGNSLTELYDKFMTEFTTRQETFDELKQLRKEEKKQEIEASFNKFGLDNDEVDDANAKTRQETFDNLKQLRNEEKKQEIEESLNKFGLDNDEVDDTDAKIRQDVDKLKQFQEKRLPESKKLDNINLIEQNKPENKPDLFESSKKEKLLPFEKGTVIGDA